MSLIACHLASGKMLLETRSFVFGTASYFRIHVSLPLNGSVTAGADDLRRCFAFMIEMRVRQPEKILSVRIRFVMVLFGCA